MTSAPSKDLTRRGNDFAGNRRLVTIHHGAEQAQYSKAEDKGQDGTLEPET